MRGAAAKRREQLARSQRQLTALVALRADDGISHAEFVPARDQIRRRILELQASSGADKERPLTDEEANDLVQALGDIPALWRELETIQKRAFGRIVMPTGYVCGEIRTAELGPLFRRFSSSGEGDRHVVRYRPDKSNTLIADIRQFLDVIRRVVRPEKRAA